jgi:tetratricopeptide (TPR) repeat protein
MRTKYAGLFRKQPFSLQTYNVTLSRIAFISQCSREATVLPVLLKTHFATIKQISKRNPSEGHRNMNRILRTKSFIASSVALVAFIVFLPSLRNEFVNWDDNNYVYDNSFIRSLDTQLLKSAFMGFHASNWHPLTWISHAIDYAMWGLNPLGHHLTNNILHALNTLIVVLLVMRLMEIFNKTTENKGLAEPFLHVRTIVITGVATGLLFGLHPLHVESVAWVAERKDLLCAFFFLLSITTYTHYVSEVNACASNNSASRFFNKKYLFAIGFFTLSLLGKPMAVSLPFVLLILDWHLFRRIQSLKAFWTVSIEKLPFLVLALISSILTLLAQEAGGAIKSIEAIPLASRVIVAAKSLIAYLVKMILPFNLVPFYPYPENISLFSLEYIIPVVIVIAITATCIAVMGKQKLWMSVWSYYVITLIPVLGIVQVGGQAMADRYTYLPSLGVFFIIGLTFARVYEKVAASDRWRVMLKTATFLMAMTTLVSLSYATVMQIGVWKNSIVFWNYVIDKDPGGGPRAHNNLGVAYSSKGQFDMAIEQYRIASRLMPDDAGVYFNLGRAYFSKGLVDMAIEQYQTALSLKPDYAKAHNNLGEAYMYKGQFDMAIEEYRIALRLMPDDAEAHYNLGEAYMYKGGMDMAIEEYQTALSLKPDDPKAHFNLGVIYLGNGSMARAKAEFEMVLKIKPGDYWARQMLNSMLSK